MLSGEGKITLARVYPAQWDGTLGEQVAPLALRALERVVIELEQCKRRHLLAERAFQLVEVQTSERDLALAREQRDAARAEHRSASGDLAQQRRSHAQLQQVASAGEKEVARAQRLYNGEKQTLSRRELEGQLRTTQLKRCAKALKGLLVQRSKAVEAERSVQIEQVQSTRPPATI